LASAETVLINLEGVKEPKGLLKKEIPTFEKPPSS
tara:strand:+ start:573 stop:677 length:105 start_codon:yes stop_codon:yes gene_type:complete